MSGLILTPGWAAMAVRTTNGILYTVELDREITAKLDIWFDKVEDVDESWRTGYRVYEAGDMHVKGTIAGIGKKEKANRSVAPASWEPVNWPDTDHHGDALDLAATDGGVFTMRRHDQQIDVATIGGTLTLTADEALTIATNLLAAVAATRREKADR